MGITYVKDEKIEYRSRILDGLKKYNKTFTGKTESEVTNIYITVDGKVIGGCQTEMEWNWVYIEALYYEDISVLNALVSVLYNRYNGLVEGIFFETYVEEQVDAFTLLGFKILGTLDDKPKGHNSYVLINQTMTNIEYKEKFNLDIFHGESELDKPFEILMANFNKINNYDASSDGLQYLAYDGDEIIGGVNGNLNQNYLYVSLLWVENKYRGQKVASRLMDLIEKDAIENGFNQFFLGTCTFQAKDFYEKRGYKVKMVVPNCPKGYDDYTMVKIIKLSKD